MYLTFLRNTISFNSSSFVDQSGGKHFTGGVLIFSRSLRIALNSPQVFSQRSVLFPFLNPMFLTLKCLGLFT